MISDSRLQTQEPNNPTLFIGDTSPMPENIIGPRVLTPDGLLV